MTDSQIMKWFVAAMLLLLFAIVFQAGLLIYAIYALLAVYFLSGYVTKTWAEGLDAQRRCESHIAEIGEQVTVNIEIKNRGWLPIVWMLVEDLLPRRALMFKPPALEVVGERISVSALKPHQSKQLEYHLKCNRRGYHQIGPLVLETGDLFGLHRRFRVLSQPNYLLVQPKIIPLDGYDVASRRPIGEVTMTHQLFEDPTRIAGVREYQRGDAFNRIHWKATARTGKLHSKIYEPSTVAGATILLDFHQDAYVAKDEPYRSELAITAAASVANAVYLTGQQVGLISNGRDAVDRIRMEGWVGDSRTRSEAKDSARMVDKCDRLRPFVVPTRVGVEQFTLIREALGRLNLTDGLDLPSLTIESLDRLPRDATVIVITPGADDRSVIALSNLKSQGFAITVLLNLYEAYDFAEAAGPLIAAGIEVRHLRDEDSIASICQKYALASMR